MLTRRRLLAFAALATGVRAFGPLTAFAQSGAQSGISPSEASAFVQAAANRLLAVVNGPGTLAQKQAAITPIVESAVDVNGVARFCLGRFWRLATPQQQQQYVQLFHAVLVNNISGKLGDYQGVTFSIGRADQRADGVQVSSVITRPNNAPNNVIWVVGGAPGAPRVIDVIAEGTSLRLTQRSDYASYLQRNGNNVGALIAALRQQTAAG